MEEKNDQPNQQKSVQGKDATLQALGNVAEGMQSSFSSIFASFEQNLQMAQSVTGLFEQVLKNSIKIETQLEPNEQGIQLTVSITNTVKIPVPGVQCSITFRSDSVHWSHLSTTQESLSSTHTPDIQKKQQQIFSIFDTTTTSTPSSLSKEEEIKPDSITLPPLCIHTEVLQIKIDQPVQCNSEIILYFPGPVPESTVPIEHTFGIYLVDQLSRKVLAEDYKGKAIQFRPCSAEALRLLLQIPSFQGLEPGLSIMLQETNAQEDSKKKIICRIEEFNKKTSMAKIAFYVESSEAHELLKLLIHELDMLNW
ncbi:hypothetical protein BDC45DRAFT_503045 [Circinella umbellata]|nr:hypothetical protein BDC45DRAFT_503045 [Circinella umbellata]